MTSREPLFFLFSLFSLSFSALALLGGCDDGAVCEAGRQVECACGDGFSGFQACNADGSGYGACRCDGIDGGTDSGVDAGDTGTDTGVSTDTGVIRDTGTADTQPPDAAMMCADEAGEPCHLCRSCATRADFPDCLDEGRACAANPDCMDFLGCAVLCGDDDSCLEGCRTDHATGAALQEAWRHCTECTFCPVSCAPTGCG